MFCISLYWWDIWNEWLNHYQSGSYSYTRNAWGRILLVTWILTVLYRLKWLIWLQRCARSILWSIEITHLARPIMSRQEKKGPLITYHIHHHFDGFMVVNHGPFGLNLWSICYIFIIGRTHQMKDLNVWIVSPLMCNVKVWILVANKLWTLLSLLLSQIKKNGRNHMGLEIVLLSWLSMGMVSNGIW